ncbi:ribokinase [Paraburkholderia sp. EG287A]|uniref:ribokinase n=1 Tax=unclassified Paraburkholderia TaxID=2615204 RepID=UPI0034D2A07D
MNATPRPLMFFGTTNLDLCFEVEHLPAAGESVMGTLARYAGGKGANQAVAAARLGAAPRFFTRIGGDEAGDFLLRSLEEAGVIVDAVEIASGEPSGSALVAVGNDGSNVVIIDPGANRHITVASISHGASFISRDTVVVAEMGLPLPALEYLFSLKREVPFTLVFNPAPVQSGMSRDAWRAVDIVTPNAAEASELTGIHVVDDKTARSAATALLELGPRAVVITLGEQGSWYADIEQSFGMPAFPVQAVDTTGAGDAFTGGLAAAIAMGRPIRSAICRAMAVAAISVTRHGAQIAMPSAREVDDFLQPIMSLES